MQKSNRIVADQRFDLPHYEQMLGLISAEFNAYNKAFFTEKNLVVRNWKVEDAGGLTVRVNIASDSLLVNSERVGFEGIAYRAAGLAALTKVLEDNAVNYVEVEIAGSTTGNDSVAIWDSTANSGSGAEFIQNSDTVTCQEPTLISNTTAFSVAQPQRIRLARVTTSGGSITLIEDFRDFFFHLATDWDFGSPTRTDLTIETIKDAFDATWTAIKEMKDSPNWYDAEGISNIDLLERINYLLVDGGTISWDLPKPAVGSLTAIPSDPNSSIADGDTLVISDGVTSVTFEFDDDASVSGGNTPITIPTNGSVASVKAAIIAAINGHAFSVTATAAAGARIELSNDGNGAVGNVAITETLSNGSSLAPVGMGGGVTTNTLSWSAALRIIAPHRAFNYTVSAQSVTNLADGELIYVTLPTEGATPGGPLAVTKVASASYPLNYANTRGFILAYRSGSKIYFGNGWQSVELEDGEQNQLGDGPSTELLTAFGFPNEYTSKPPYTSNYWVSPGAPFTTAISELDGVADALWGMVTGKVYEESVISTGPGLFDAGDYVTLPPPFGMGANQTYQTAFNQLEVFFNGAKANVDEDWYEDANVGAGIGNRIQLAYGLPANTKITFRIQTGGGQTGTVGADAPDIYDEGVLVMSQVGSIDFIGAATRVEPTGPTSVSVTTRAIREMGKLYKNMTGVTIAAGKPVAFMDDGTIALADADNTTLFDFAGITDEAIPHGSFGLVLKSGNVAGALTALAPTPGAAVYLTTTPGVMSLTPPPNPLTDLIIRLGRAEPPDGVVSATGDDLWLHPEVISEP